MHSHCAPNLYIRMFRYAFIRWNIIYWSITVFILGINETGKGLHEGINGMLIMCWGLFISLFGHLSPRACPVSRKLANIEVSPPSSRGRGRSMSAAMVAPRPPVRGRGVDLVTPDTDQVPWDFHASLNRCPRKMTIATGLGRPIWTLPPGEGRW